MRGFSCKTFAFVWLEPRLFNLGFLVLNVLTDDRIKFLDQHLFRHVAFVLRRRIEVTRACGRFQLDLVACAFRHDLLLRLHRVRADLRAQRRYRSCRSGAGRRSKRADAPNGFRFPPKYGGFAGSAGTGAWFCCSRGKRCCRSSALSQLLGIRVPYESTPNTLILSSDAVKVSRKGRDDHSVAYPPEGLLWLRNRVGNRQTGILAEKK